MPLLERLLRPFEGGAELYPDEVANLAVHAIPHMPLKLLLGRLPADLHSQWDRGLHLQAGPRSANIFQKCGRVLLSTRTIPPANLNHIRAQHPSFRTLLLHNSHIGGQAAPLYTTVKCFSLKSVTICY